MGRLQRRQSDPIDIPTRRHASAPINIPVNRNRQNFGGFDYPRGNQRTNVPAITANKWQHTDSVLSPSPSPSPFISRPIAAPLAQPKFEAASLSWLLAEAHFNLDQSEKVQQHEEEEEEQEEETDSSQDDASQEEEEEEDGRMPNFPLSTTCLDYSIDFEL